MHALKIAEQIISDGRIVNQNDWEEMKIELEHEFNEMGLSKDEQEKALEKVRRAWY